MWTLRETIRFQRACAVVPARQSRSFMCGLHEYKTSALIHNCRYTKYYSSFRAKFPEHFIGINVLSFDIHFHHKDLSPPKICDQEPRRRHHAFPQDPPPLGPRLPGLD